MIENTEKMCEICHYVIASRKHRVLKKKKKITFYLVAVIRRNYLEIRKHRNSFCEHSKAFRERHFSTSGTVSPKGLICTLVIR